MDSDSHLFLLTNTVVRGVERVTDADRGWKATLLGVGIVLAGSFL